MILDFHPVHSMLVPKSASFAKPGRADQRLPETGSHLTESLAQVEIRAVCGIFQIDIDITLRIYDHCFSRLFVGNHIRRH